VQQFPPQYAGRYFFADLCGNWIRVLDPATRSAANFATGISEPVDLKVGAEGSLYVLSRGDGAVYRISYNAGQAPILQSLSLSSTSVRGGRSVRGTVRFDGPVSVAETVLLTSDFLRLAAVPARVRVKKGQAVAHFTVRTRRPGVTREVGLHARWSTITEDAVLTVRH
jgi:hypothetical protein